MAPCASARWGAGASPMGFTRVKSDTNGHLNIQAPLYKMKMHPSIAKGLQPNKSLSGSRGHARGPLPYLSQSSPEKQRRDGSRGRSVPREGCSDFPAAAPRKPSRHLALKCGAEQGHTELLSISCRAGRAGSTTLRRGRCPISCRAGSGPRPGTFH